MEHFVVSARKYRPKTFKNVVGQQAITNTLLNAIDNNHLAQALLFCGPRGVGKTSCARILAKQINQQEHQDENEDFAFNIFELDAASNNSVDDIRSLIEQVRIPPQVGSYKVYIIDEVHMLSQAAFNAFLKTLEEPPKHAIFILATTEKHKIIPTILSRCQVFDFKRITVKDAAEYLAYIAKEQGITAEEDALHIIAQKADGAMRDALSIFDRVVSFSGSNLTRQAVTENLNVLDYDTYFKATDYILNNQIPELLILFNECLAKGFDGHHFIAGLASHFRDLLVCQNQATIPLLEVGERAKQQYLEQSKLSSQGFLITAIDKANDCDLKYKTSKNQRLLVELCLMQLASITFNGEKKKPNNFIIPATFFISTHSSVITKPVELPKVETSTSQQQENIISEPKPETKQPTMKPEKNRISGLSLASVKKKQDHLKAKQEKETQHVELPTDPFKDSDLINFWNKYIEILHKKGEKILASILEVDIPKIKNETIHLEFPNETMKVELERAQYPILAYLRKKVNNYNVNFHIVVNEATQKKYAFTAREKFEKLCELNPALDLLRKEFDLDI
ncbi:DNA polymerase III subunit gamma/tau [Pseudofulvibacter geojedonensis]|uniref:DNA polymerase III subunit gamma/tau n=1 Tax=Pseudofulvibacter geojedonensis TaxID=1123758 RepID=A0ABW3HY26_9FLAO